MSDKAFIIAYILLTHPLNVTDVGATPILKLEEFLHQLK